MDKNILKCHIDIKNLDAARENSRMFSAYVVEMLSSACPCTLGVNASMWRQLVRQGAIGLISFKVSKLFIFEVLNTFWITTLVYQSSEKKL